MKILGLLLVALLLCTGVASACGKCHYFDAATGSICFSERAQTGCVSICDGPNHTGCTCQENPCGGGGSEEGGLVKNNDEDKPEPVTALTPFKNLSLAQMSALCAVTPGCTMYSDNYAAHGPRGLVIRGPRTWGGVKAFYR